MCSGRGDFGYSRCLSTNIEDCEGHPRCPDDGPDEFRYHCLQYVNSNRMLYNYIT